MEGAGVKDASHLFDSPTICTWECQVCGERVEAECHSREVDPFTPVTAGRRRIRDGEKVLEVWYTPASRYWTDSGVLCSPECGLKLTRNNAP